MRPYLLHWLAHHMRADVANVLAPSWFTCVGLAGVVALVLMLVLARRRGIEPATVASAVLWCYVAAVLAGILVPAVIDGIEHLLATGHVRLRWSGMTSFWGYLAGAAAVAHVCRREGVALARVADLAVIPLGVALAFARTGCFMAGCDYGKVSSVPWAVRFPAGSPAWRDHVHAGLISASSTQSLPVHPTELYEALLGLVIVGIAILFARRRRKDGELFILAAATYAIGRIAIEMLRGDAGRGVHAGLSSGQIFSLLVLVAIAARFVVRTRRRVTMAATAGALALTFGEVSAADAQGVSGPQSTHPTQRADSEEPPRRPALAAPPTSPAVIAAAADPTERPLFSTGVLFGLASPLNRREHQVATLSGGSLSIGYLPGRFGLWIDIDSLSNGEASHDTFLAAGSVSHRPTRRLMLGLRAGIGVSRVDFKDPAFRDVGAMTYRFEAIAEYAYLRHWAVWVRPLTIDVLSAPALGGAITTYQLRVGFAYRFGSRRNRVRPPPPPPAVPPPLPAVPPLPPTSRPELGALP
ncbi:MAG TPA: prolipoprotein diacylglyceryl transferase family protein [Kofleriaceae bacterium]|nr:prolipoprotein diacylglyceryl transferase family protein [Kofleriaceae bacterium]